MYIEYFNLNWLKTESEYETKITLHCFIRFVSPEIFVLLSDFLVVRIQSSKAQKDLKPEMTLVNQWGPSKSMTEGG